MLGDREHLEYAFPYVIYTVFMLYFLQVNWPQ